jgi:enoyl-CoA hydratase/carnithine racemase
MAANASPMSTAMSKRILWSGAGLHEIDDLETAAHEVLMGSADSLEGGAAAAAKRSPNFTSRVSTDWPTSGPFAG